MTTNNKEVEEMADQTEWENLKRHLAENYVEKGWTAVTDEVMKALLASRDAYWKERVLKEVEGMRMTSHLDPAFFLDKNKWMKTVREQRAFGEGNNQALDTLLDKLNQP